MSSRTLKRAVFPSVSLLIAVVVFSLTFSLTIVSSQPRGAQSPKPTKTSSRAEKARPPEQPLTGPGGKQYAHASVTKNRYGEGGKEYWLFEPDQPKPKLAPLIIFVHGWGGMNPMYYGAWLDHLVKRGNIVVYPRYQSGLLTHVKDFTPNTIHAVKDAITRLQTEQGHISPDLNKVAVVGHSMGGLLAANIAALASESGLPRVRAVMSVEPGITDFPISFPLAQLKKIPSDTLLLSIAGEEDGLVGDSDAKRIYRESTLIPQANKNFITLMTDEHGMPQLKAGHRAPTAPDESYDSRELLRTTANRVGGPTSQQNSSPRSELEATAVNAMDYYGTWKLFDGLCDAAFYGKNREYALGNTPQQRFMGKWSDGVAVKELKVLN